MLQDFPNFQHLDNFPKLFKNHIEAEENKVIYLDHYCIIDS